MKAWVLSDVNKLEYQEVADPVAGDDEVIVKVKASGICGSDIGRIFKDGAHVMPIICGHEFAGEVVETGERVGVFPLIPCGECECCKNKKYEMCRNYKYLGSRCDGGFAEYVKVPKWNIIPLPEKVSYEAAAMLEPMAVAVHAMRSLFEGVLNYGYVCISGLGAVGMSLLMFVIDVFWREYERVEDSHPDSNKRQQESLMNLLSFMGKRVLVIGNKDIQYNSLKAAGFLNDNFCDVRKEDVGKWLNEKTNGHGVDCFFECVGTRQSIEYAIENAACGGNIMLVGNPASDMDIPKEKYWKILRKQLVIKGTWNSSFTKSDDDDWHYVINRINEGYVWPERLISHKLSFDELDKGLEMMKTKSEEYIKVMVTM